MTTITLSLGDHALTLNVGANQHRLPIGIATLVQSFRHRMPDALALENAIADVEDAVMPAAQWIPADQATLHSEDPLLIALMQQATGNPHATHASREAIENLFSALARQAQQPGMQDPQLLQTAEFAAALLIAREILHHWGLSAIARV